MTACWFSGRLFWPFVKNGGLLEPNFGKIISGDIFDQKKGYSRDYFEPKFRSLGPLVSILQVFFVQKRAFLCQKRQFLKPLDALFANFVVKKLILRLSITFSSIIAGKQILKS